MRRLLLLICLSVAVSSFAQIGSDNPFKQSESGTNVTNKPGTGNENVDNGPNVANDAGNPGDPQPIDDYVPFLVLTAVGIIAYVSYGKRYKMHHLK